MRSISITNWEILYDRNSSFMYHILSGIWRLFSTTSFFAQSNFALYQTTLSLFCHEFTEIFSVGYSFFRLRLLLSLSLVSVKFYKSSFLDTSSRNTFCFFLIAMFSFLVVPISIASS